jgi:hypothetical protein
MVAKEVLDSVIGLKKALRMKLPKLTLPCAQMGAGWYKIKICK